MNRVRFSIAFIGILFGWIFFMDCEKDIEGPIDLVAFQNTGDDWKVIVQDTLPDGGHIKLNHDHWLMYFLHWRPLSEENKNISVEYAKERMLNFWGPDIPFTITSEGGVTEIGGHQAYFIDGSFSNGIVQTRFIVWNCPETKRQFIADCNINTRRGTSEKLLKLQYHISATISCHGQAVNVDHPSLTQKYKSDKYYLSFCIPETWRTDEYTEPKWFPEGPSDTNGTLWTLLTDSNKYIDLVWYNAEKGISESLFREAVEWFKNRIWDFEQITFSISDFKIDQVRKIRDDFVGTGSYRMNYQYREQKGGERFLYRAYLRNYRDKTYFLIVSIISRNMWWNRPVDLTPSIELFKIFLNDEVFPNIPAFRHGIKFD